MFNSVKMPGLVFSLSVLTGCMTNAKGPSFTESKATQQKPGHAALYIFREHAEPTAWGATIHIDGKEVATLKQHNFTWAYVKPGNRNIAAVWPFLSGQNDAVVSLNVVEGETYYMELEGFSGIESALGIFVIMDSSLNCLEPNEAQAKLKKSCAFRKPARDSY